MVQARLEVALEHTTDKAGHAALQAAFQHTDDPREARRPAIASAIQAMRDDVPDDGPNNARDNGWGDGFEDGRDDMWDVEQDQDDVQIVAVRFPEDEDPVDAGLAENVQRANERAIAKRLRLEVLRDLTDRLSDLDSDNPDSEDEHQAGSITESVNNLDDVSGSNESDSDREHVNFNDALQVGDNVNDDAEPSEHSELDESFEERPPSPPQEANNNDGDSLEYLTKFLAGWARRGVSFKKVDELLAGLNVLYPMLTKCHKVLLRCDTIRNFEVVGEGELWYKGFSANLNQRLTPEYLNKHREIVIDINMDGLDLHESSKLKFWPILGCLKGQRTPFIVGCYCGESHPDIEGHLRSFVEDANHLQDNGFLAFGRNYEVKIRHFILDAPARALVKCCAGHSSKAACEKCDVVGYSKYSRIVFVGVNGDLRTDESFSNREQPSHHKGMSPLERDLNVKMVSQFRLDVLHLVHGGVFKRWLLYLIGDLHRKETAEELHVRKYNRDNGIAQERFKPRGKVTAASKNAISDAIFNIAPSMPHDFSRRPRPLQYIHQYKCTEYRRLLLYDGIRVFKGNIPSNAYRNFLLLHTGLYILSSPTFVKEDVWLNVAREVLDSTLWMNVLSMVKLTVSLLTNLKTIWEVSESV
ncbi:hypothetical protein FOCC_FOCC013231 [Frankliniella occidentalis]|nr:hypothetical protein FOCC_FOCC013231 [Frankliniella occidentalis]